VVLLTPRHPARLVDSLLVVWQDLGDPRLTAEVWDGRSLLDGFGRMSTGGGVWLSPCTPLLCASCTYAPHASRRWENRIRLPRGMVGYGNESRCLLHCVMEQSSRHGSVVDELTCAALANRSRADQGA
jgi:hypothetical protein